jgi:hypothetical protein
MIHVFFVPGMFGSTIEYICRSFSNELTPVEGTILATGSMHSFKKSAHFLDTSQVESFFNSNNFAGTVTTPIYPFKKTHLPEILKKFNNHITEKDSCILMYAVSAADVELNMLFQYHKISVCLKKGLNSFCDGNENNITAWNTTYTHWSQMQTWQLREWISLFYVSWGQEWIESQHQVTSNFLCIPNTDFLFNTIATSDTLFSHCGLTKKPGLVEFLQKWQTAQKYVIDEFELLNNIVTSSVDNQLLTWKPINIIAEAIVQQRLRALGYEIQCDGLNTFPTDAKTLHNLLEKI